MHIPEHIQIIHTIGSEIKNCKVVHGIANSHVWDDHPKKVVQWGNFCQVNVYAFSYKYSKLEFCADLNEHLYKLRRISMHAT